MYWHGRDKQYRPLLIIQASKLDEVSAEMTTRLLVFCFEFFLRYLVVAGRVENWIILADCAGKGVSNFPISMLKHMVEALNARYRGRMYRMFVVNAPTLINLVSKPFLGALPASTSRKVKVYSSNFKDEVKKLFSPSQLETRFGGVLPDLEANFYPFNFFSGPFQPTDEHEEEKITSSPINNLHDKIPLQILTGRDLSSVSHSCSSPSSCYPSGRRCSEFRSLCAALQSLNLTSCCAKWLSKSLHHKFHPTRSVDDILRRASMQPVHTRSFTHRQSTPTPTPHLVLAPTDDSIQHTAPPPPADSPLYHTSSPIAPSHPISTNTTSSPLPLSPTLHSQQLSTDGLSHIKSPFAATLSPLPSPLSAVTCSHTPPSPLTPNPLPPANYCASEQQQAQQQRQEEAAALEADEEIQALQDAAAAILIDALAVTTRGGDTPCATESVGTAEAGSSQDRTRHEHWRMRHTENGEEVSTERVASAAATSTTTARGDDVVVDHDGDIVSGGVPNSDLPSIAQQPHVFPPTQTKSKPTSHRSSTSSSSSAGNKTITAAKRHHTRCSTTPPLSRLYLTADGRVFCKRFSPPHITRRQDSAPVRAISPIAQASHTSTTHTPHTHTSAERGRGEVEGRRRSADIERGSASRRDRTCVSLKEGKRIGAPTVQNKSLQEVNDKRKEETGAGVRGEGVPLGSSFIDCSVQLCKITQSSKSVTLRQGGGESVTRSQSEHAGEGKRR
eukprot:GHVQ01005956.1.p1 GENE.GHVQ01005956.1~~GHVQ01005956.1.p1  ORF type:complete len:729 (-),score=139.93 GHVQ01005956.1:450-2636(-)